MKSARTYYYLNPEMYNKVPKQLIKISQQNNFNQGSATMVVLTLLQKQKILKSAQIGDSRYVIFRPQKSKLTLIFQSPEHQHAFNFPFQLGSPTLQFSDSPQTALGFKHNIKQNDILVVGSDGLFDNIFIEEIRKQLQKHLQGETLTDKKKIAQDLAKEAIRRGGDMNFISPFAQRAKNFGINIVGGKLDDTTVIICQINLENVKQDDL